MLLQSKLLFLLPLPSSPPPPATAKTSSSVVFVPVSRPLNWKSRKPRAAAAASYEVGGAYPDEELDRQDRVSGGRGEEDAGRLDKDQCDALLKGGEQVTSVLQEMITLLEDMEMDGASEKVAVELAAQGVIGKRVDEMESGFMMALDYMIQLAERDQDDEVLDSSYLGKWPVV